MYIFNPKYKLKSDVERILLVNESRFGSASFMSFVHPVYAWILNLFDGKSSNNQVFCKIKNVLELRDSEIKKLIAPLLSNPKETAIRYGGVISRFPSFVLIDNSLNKFREKENDDFFDSIKTVNHTDWRLFRPINLLICPTLKCYTDCIYCYADRHFKHEELNSDVWLNFIDQAKQFGIERIDVTGGEFFLKKGWKEIAKRLTSNGYFPEISTKIPLSCKDIDAIIEAGLRSLQVSLDTIDTNVAADTLGVDSQYVSKLKETIIYADKLGLRLILKPTLTKYTCTINNIQAILEFADSLENVERIVVSVIGFSCYKSKDLYPKIRPSLIQIGEIRSFLKVCSQKFRFPIHDDTFIYMTNEMRNNRTFTERARCTANVEGFVILPDGTATLCEELYWNKNFIIGNITQKSILQIWRSSEALKLATLNEQDLPPYSNCRQCEQLMECHKKRGVCWKLIISAYGMGNAFNPDPRCPKAPISKVPFTIG